MFTCLYVACDAEAEYPLENWLGGFDWYCAKHIDASANLPF